MKTRFCEWLGATHFEASYITIKDAINKLNVMEQPTWKDYYNAFQLAVPQEFDGNKPIFRKSLCGKRQKLNLQLYPNRKKKEVIIFVS